MSSRTRTLGRAADNASANRWAMSLFQYTYVIKSTVPGAVDGLEHRREDPVAVAEHRHLVALGEGDAGQTLAARRSRCLPLEPSPGALRD